MESVRDGILRSKISALPSGPTSWRIDWFGDIAFPDRTIRRQQPSVFLHLSRVTAERFREDPSTLLSADSTAPARFQKRVWISVGTLPLLRIGDIWRDGQLEFRPDYELEEFRDVQIDPTTTTLVKAGLNLDEKGFLLPLAEHPWHHQCTQSYCLVVNLSEKRRVIIPCLELIRFYFGSSSGLLTKLFLPPLTRKSLYSNASLDPSTGHLQITLAEKMTGYSAADIGRLHLDPIAWKAALLVGSSMLKASVAQLQVHPQAIFPFEGKTTLTACGKWLSFAGEPRKTFLIYSLRSCSHPFPFKSLRYEVKGSRPKPGLLNGAAVNSEQSPPRSAAKDSNHQDLIEKDPSNNLAPKTSKVQVEVRFPDLVRKPVWKTQISGQAGPFASPQESAQPVESAAVGEPGSEFRARPLDFVLATKRDSSGSESIPPFLREVVLELRSLRNVSAELLTASDHDGWTVPISILSDENGEIDARLFVDDSGGSTRLRRAAVIALAYEAERLCVVAIESVPVHLKFYITTGRGSEEVWRTLRCAAQDFLGRTVQALNPENLCEEIYWAFGIGDTGKVVTYRDRSNVN